jgi:hypothetical protein
MRHVGNFNPEWGYLAPAPSLLRTARVFLVAAAIGGTTSAAVVFSLMDRPAAETTVAARTLVLSAEPSLSAPATKLIAQQPAQSALNSVSPTPGAEAMGPHAAAGAAHATAGPVAPSESSAAPTTPTPPVAAALAEAPRVTTTDAPPLAQALAPEGNAVLAAQAAPAAAPAPVLKGAAKKARAATRAAVAPRYDVPRYAAPRYEAMQRGPYAFLRQIGTFGQPY